MTSNILNSIFLELGLTYIDTEIYKLLINSQNLTISLIAKELNIHRDKVYKSLAKMEEFGLLTQIKNHTGKIELNSPSHLMALIQKKNELI